MSTPVQLEQSIIPNDFPHWDMQCNLATLIFVLNKVITKQNEMPA